jgi:4'-phosphopantetheinyl transferase EntD
MGLRLILPECVAVATVRRELDVELYSKEEDAVAGMAEARRVEFTTGRACAREALTLLGEPPCAIPRTEAGVPQWPRGIIGSITHCTGYRACAVGRLSDLATLGIDAEPNLPLPHRVLARIAAYEERALVRGLSAETPHVRWDRLLFSIKESIYKAWFPLIKQLSFDDIVIAVDRCRGTFSARLLVPTPPLGHHRLTGLRGGWTVDDGIIMTAVATPEVAPGLAEVGRVAG